jgi:prepilin-type processing-associated H-X9-DG protein
MRAREIKPGMPIRIEDHFGRNATGIAGQCFKDENYRYAFCNVIFADGHVYPVCVTKITRYVQRTRTIAIDFDNLVRNVSQRIHTTYSVNGWQ